MNNIWGGEDDYRKIEEMVREVVLSNVPEKLATFLVSQIIIGIVYFILRRSEKKFVKTIRKILVAIAIYLWGMFIYWIILYLKFSK